MISFWIYHIFISFTDIFNLFDIIIIILYILTGAYKFHKHLPHLNGIVRNLKKKENNTYQYPNIQSNNTLGENKKGNFKKIRKASYPTSKKWNIKKAL